METTKEEWPPNRDRIVVLMPSMDRRIDIGCISGMMACHTLWRYPFFIIQNSNISDARDNLAHQFLTKYPACDWSMWIDSDIVFTLQDWELLWEQQSDEKIVVAEYAKKLIGQPPAKFGFGFVRIHRSVFESINALTNEDGTETALRYYSNSQMLTHFFVNGVTGDSRRLAEDHGFFGLCAQAQIPYRVETRTKLRHVGTLEYGYPDQLPGFKFVDAETGSN